MKSGSESGAPEAESTSASTINNRSNTASTVWRSLQWWPSIAAIAFAAFVARDLFSGDEHGSELASIVAASGLVYLVAAALQRPSTAWSAFLAAVVIITAAKTGVIGFDATWLLLGLAILFAGYGVLRGATCPAGGLPLQSIAMVGFGSAAAIALYMNPTAGAYLIAAGLLGHAGWDAYHHWTNRVVTRSLAEFCFVLDVLLAVAIVVVTARS